jgi:general secretion pathway protein G
MPARAGLDSNTEIMGRQGLEYPHPRSWHMNCSFSTVNTRRHSTSPGFSLIELLIVVAVIGLISAIAIPNLITAIQRARQTRSMADLKTLARALSLYEQDSIDYPVETSLVSAENLRPALRPYMGEFETLDGWRRPFMYISNGRHYTLISYALGGVANLPYTIGPIHRLEEDIVMSNGVFVQWPEGVQH